MARRIFSVFAVIAVAMSFMAPAATAKQPELSIDDLRPAGITPVLDSEFHLQPVVVDGEKLIGIIIDLETEPLATYGGGLPGLAATSPQVTGEALDTGSLDAQRYLRHLKSQLDSFERTLKSSAPEAEVIHRYDVIIGGVSALVSPDSVAGIEALPGVNRVFFDTIEQPVTENSPFFIGADGAWAQLGGQDVAGEGVIVANIDTGVWPEHPSFSDPDPLGNAYPPPPLGFSGTTCDFGNTEVNPDDASFTCNNKLIAAYNFNQTYEAVVGLEPAEFSSARDSNGHGTHTLSTAAGNAGVAASILGSELGVVSGVAPRAHVVAYKGCGLQGCFSSDTSAAVQQAISDGVDVINYSISGGGDPYNDVVSLAFLDAFAAGVFVSPSGGNSGPGADTVAHREPWTTTVAASTHDRSFRGTITLFGQEQSEGAQVTVVHGVPGVVVDVYVDGMLALEDFVPGSVEGPLSMPAGSYDIAINMADKQDAILQTTAVLGDGDNVSLVAHLTADPTPVPTLSAFANDTSVIADGDGRITVRHTAAAPAVDIWANGAVLFGNLSNPNGAAADVPADTYEVAIAAAGTTDVVAGPLDLEVPEGTNRIVYAYGDLAGGTFALAIQDIDGLGTDSLNSLTLEGVTVTGGIDTPTPVVLAADAGDELCLSPFAPDTFDGEIVVCERGIIARVAKSFNVAAGGAGGMVLYNPVLQSLVADNHFIPSLHVQNDVGQQLLDFLASNANVIATMSGGAAAASQGDTMAAFSSRGGPNQTLGISKPDVTAPGVEILAGHTPLPDEVAGGSPGQLFQAIAGTSMSAPHVAGAAALVIDLRDWNGFPGKVKSALMTTAKTDDVFKEDGVTPADPFDYGSGRILPAVAGKATLTISASANDFVFMEDHLWDTNYPSLYVPVFAGQAAVHRTLKNEVGQMVRWRISVDAPADVDVRVPPSVTIAPYLTSTFEIAIDARDVPFGEVRFAELTFTKGDETHHMPLTIVRRQPAVSMGKTCAPASIAKGDTTTCTITLTNTTFDDADVTFIDPMPRELRVVPGSVEGGFQFGNSVIWGGELSGGEAIVDAAVDPLASPVGYLSLTNFGSSLVINLGDESISNWTIPSFDFAGESYNRIGVVSNGYIVVGGGGGGDVSFINHPLPSPSAPNNTLASFWTDLNPGAGGTALINVLGGGGNVWTVVEFLDVPNWGDGETNTFQIWIGSNTDANPGTDISYVYGPNISDGDGGFLTVGAENVIGTSGGMVYFDGAGEAPSPSFPIGDYEVDVISFGQPGESQTITFDAQGVRVGEYTNYAYLFSHSFFGNSVVGFDGAVLDAGDVPMSVALSGFNEVPDGSGDPDGTGTADLVLNESLGEVCFDITLQNVDGNVVGAHIHEAVAGTNGGVVVNFDTASNGLSGCVTADPGLIGEIVINPSGYYVNVHTDVYPAGAVRGQLA